MDSTPSRRKSPPRNRFADLRCSQLNQTEKQTLVALALKVLQQSHRPGQELNCPTRTRQYLRLRLADYRTEVFGCLFLDAAHRVLAVRELFQGTIDGAAVYPRVVVEQALAANAAALVFYHNHPSGVAEPSQADRRITERLQAALALVDIRVLDHLVVTNGESLSFAEQGLL